MRSADNYHHGFGPYCRCCGSREIMSLDVSIDESRDWERRSRLKSERLWLAIDGLGDGELAEFIQDALPHVNVEEDNEVEYGLHSYLLNWSIYLPDKTRSYREHRAVDIDEIEEPNEGQMPQDRKYAFLRLWESFDAKTKVSFIRRASEDLEKANGVQS